MNASERARAREKARACATAARTEAQRGRPPGYSTPITDAIAALAAAVDLLADVSEAQDADVAEAVA